MSTRLAEYGEVRFSYMGDAGVLTLRDGTEHTCRFEAGQLENGDVLVLCIVPDARLFFEADVAAFIGTDSQGWTVVAKGLHSVTYLPTESTFASYIACHADRLTANAPESSTAFQHRFGLTNLRFTGTERWAEYDTSGRLVRGEPVLRVKLEEKGRPSVDVMIQDNATQTKTARMLGVSRGRAITAEAVVEAGLPVDETWKIVDDLAMLLSVARGTRIQAVYVEALAEKGRPLHRVHHPGLGRTFSAWMVLSHTHEHADPTRRFLEGGYPRLISEGAELNVMDGILPAYIDSRAEHDFLEVRAMKFAVVAEMLKAAYLRHPRATVKEFETRWPKGRCASAQRAIARVVRRLRLPSSWSDKIDVEPMRRRTEFGNILRALLQHIGMNVDGREVKLFVASRNALVHEGRFYVDAAKPEQRQRLPPLADKLSEYFFLISFLDRFMLKLLGYSGPYVDWAKYPAHEEGILK